MKPSLITALPLGAASALGAALAPPPSPPTVAPGDGMTIARVLTDMKTDYKGLLDAITSLDCDHSLISKHAAAALDTIKAGPASIAESGALAKWGGVGVYAGLVFLAEESELLTGALKARRAGIETARACGTVRDFLDGAVVGTRAIMVEIEKQVPSHALAIIVEKGLAAIEVITTAQPYFTTEQCIDAR